MVWIKNIGMRPAFVCGSCGLMFRDTKAALQCEEFCKKNNACSPEIAKKAMEGQ